MRFILRQISGLEDACASLKFTNRNWTEEWDDMMREHFANAFTRQGKYRYNIDNEKSIEFVEKQLELIAKYGAGYGNASYEAGHDTLLRFIDFTVVVENLHLQAIADLDSHAMRMCNRIVRTSSRNGNTTNSDLESDWYKERICTFDKLFISNPELVEHLPERITVGSADAPEDRVTMVRTLHGYVKEDLVGNGDAERGLYHLHMASSCILKVDLFNLRHIYKRRNPFTKAAPELAAGIEQLAEQCKEWLPILGNLITDEYCDDGQLHHVMSVVKHFDQKRADSLKSSLIDERNAQFGKH